MRLGAIGFMERAGFCAGSETARPLRQRANGLPRWRRSSASVNAWMAFCVRDVLLVSSWREPLPQPLAKRGVVDGSLARLVFQDQARRGG